MNIHGSFTTELERGFQTFDGDVAYDTLHIRVEYVYYPFCPGACERCGPQIEPDTPAKIEITSVKYTNGVEIALADAERETLEAQCFQDVADNEEAAAERRAEDRRELL